MSTGPAEVALATGALALLVWTVAALELAGHRRAERRGSQFLVVGMSWIASLGMLASAVGAASVRGLISLGIDPDVLSFVSSFGRGALLAGGIVFVVRWRTGR